MKWENETRHGEIIASGVEIGCFRLDVHHYMGCGETWFVSCQGIFHNEELGEMLLDDAKIMAGERLQIKLEEAISLQKQTSAFWRKGER